MSQEQPQEGTFKEPPKVDQEKERPIEPPVDNSVYSSGISLQQSSDNVSNHNMIKLAQFDEWTIGGKVFKRRKLNPRRKAELEKTILEAASINPDKIEQKLKKQCLAAKIALLNFTDADFDDENMDSAMLEQVIGVCLMLSKGFRAL